MKRVTVVVLTVCLSATRPGAVIAGPYADTLAKCLVASTTDTEKNGLEHFRFLCSEAIAAVSDKVCTFVGHEQAQCRGHQFAHMVERARTGGA
jgi:hypothetical protein